MQTVLIIDDEFGVAEVLQSLLEDEGYRVFTAINGRQGLARLPEITPDLVMVDYMMPIMDGTQTVAAIRADPAFAHLPILLMSSLEEDMVRETCTDYTAFMRKPFRAVGVIAVVARLLTDARK